MLSLGTAFLCKFQFPVARHEWDRVLVASTFLWGWGKEGVEPGNCFPLYTLSLHGRCMDGLRANCFGRSVILLHREGRSTLSFKGTGRGEGLEKAQFKALLACLWPCFGSSVLNCKPVCCKEGMMACL